MMAKPQDAFAAFRMDKRVAIVTGGASGIGREAAILLAAAGAHVVIADRDEAAARAAAAEIGTSASAVGMDAGDEASIEHAVAQTVKAHGRLDVLIANAGINIRKPAVEIPREDWDRVIGINLTGVFLSARVAAKAMIAGGNGGAIISTASIMSLSGGGLYPNIAYQTAKGALVNMTRALAVEWAGHNIRVNAVAPTWVRTPFIQPLMDNPAVIERITAMTPLGRMAEPEEVAAAMLFLAGPAAAMITGHTLPVDGGFLAQ